MSPTNGHIVYCAGPMFSPGDQIEMSTIAASLEAAHYATYLPQRDGIEVARVMKSLEGGGHELATPPPNAQQVTDLMRKAVFALDLFQLLSRCDCVVFNMNGRVPDDGGVSETSMAFSAGKPVVIYKDDPITILMGLDNPLVQGLSYTWAYAESYEAVAPMLTAFLAQYRQLWGAPPKPNFSGYVTGAIAIGAQVWGQLVALRAKYPDDPKSPDNPMKVVAGLIAWIMAPETQAAFAKAFPRAVGSSAGAQPAPARAFAAASTGARTP